MVSEIQTINRLLASTSILEAGSWAKELDVAEYYTTQYVYPVRDIFSLAKSFCVDTSLLESQRDRIRLSDLGSAYLGLGDRKAGAYLLEPNQKQKGFLSRKVFLTGKMLDLVGKLLYHFSKGTHGELQLSKEAAATLEDQNLLKLLLQLGILIERDQWIELAAEYADFLEKFRSESLMVVTPEMFERAEAEKRELSKIAEEYVLKSERARLKISGATEQAMKVDYVAMKNVAAGYDIASFRDQNSKSYDKFIEVKAGRSTPIKFFFSRNELETAKRLMDKYCIFYVSMKNKTPQEIFVFSNPAEGIMKDQKFLVQTDTYEISEK